MKVTSSPSRWAVIATAASPLAAAVPASATSCSNPSRRPSAPDLDALQRRHLLAGQGQSPPQERCEAVGTGESCQGNPQLLTHPHRFMRRADPAAVSLLPQPAIAGPSLGSMKTAYPCGFTTLGIDNMRKLWVIVSDRAADGYGRRATAHSDLQFHRGIALMAVGPNTPRCIRVEAFSAPVLSTSARKTRSPARSGPARGPESPASVEIQRETLKIKETPANMISDVLLSNRCLSVASSAVKRRWNDPCRNRCTSQGSSGIVAA